MHLMRRAGVLAALMSALLLSILPAHAGAAGGQGALPIAGVQAWFSVTARQAPPVASRDRMIPLAATSVVSATASETPTVVISPTATMSATATSTPSATSTARPSPTATPTRRPTRTPAPTRTPTPRPTATPPPTDTPTPMATSTPVPKPIAVHLVSLGLYVVEHGRERRLTKVTPNTQVRLRIIVDVANVPNGGSIRVTATWQFRGLDGLSIVHSYTSTATVGNGRSALYYDVVIPERGLVAGAYRFDGTLTYRGQVQHAATLFHVTGPAVPEVRPMRVHYAHLRMTVPAFWFLDFSQDSQGRRATGVNTLIMYSNTRRAGVVVVSPTARSTPSAALLHQFPAIILDQEFGGVTNVMNITFKGQIDGNDVFAAEGDVMVASRSSHAIDIVTFKDKTKRLYSFLILSYFKAALPSEIHAALAAIFGAKLD